MARDTCCLATALVYVALSILINVCFCKLQVRTSQLQGASAFRPQDAGSINAASDCKDLYHGEEVSGGFLEPGGQASHVFHFAKAALDDVSLGIEIVIVRD